MSKKDGIIGQAWKITRRHKFLWLFGLLAALGPAASTIGNLAGTGLIVATGQRSALGGAWLFQMPGSWIRPFSLSLLVTVVSSIILWALGLVARACLIQSVAEAEHRLEHRKRTGKQKRKGTELLDDLTMTARFRGGAAVLPRLVAMQGLLWLPVAALSVAAVLSQKLGGAGASLAGLLVMITTLGSVVLVLVDTFAFRAIALDGAGTIQSIRIAVTALRGYLSQVLQAVLSIFIALIPFACVLAIVSSPLMLKAAAAQTQALNACMAEHGQNIAAFQECAMQSWFSGNQLANGWLYGLVLVSVIIGAVYTTFVSAVGTLLYRALAPLFG